ncbi:DNA damage-regulated autophagy modulator protein 2-like [Actinia tenebrosa]|uniref:DNA damage-regulated autophagy modulator protein 2-like n=1 Tax=Actinia tenebrosa TaxID=6105 RepID=A0A6P8H486_ACTTE|nr:DNA damage-regulated autophagy modulator protein 2-like [Actinia tenebrosa]
MSCLKPGLGYLPMFWSLFAGIALAICYTIATSRGHIYPYVPAISDTGLKIPENALFSESFNFIAYSVLVLMVIRYFQVREILATGTVEELKGNTLQKLNQGSIVLGSLSAFGATLVGNFKSEREHHAMMVVHDIGSICLFSGGTFYFWAQTIITYNFAKAGYNTMCMFGVRLFLTILTSICGLTFFLAEIPAYKAFIRSGTKNSIQQWKPENAGYALHVLSNVCEWVGTSCFAILVSTFFKEFQKISLSVHCSLDGYSSLSVEKYSTFGRINSETGDDSDQ